ncbi:MAG: CHAT domain-containing protein [Candidatus Hydrogenedentes bacterium]|nr:CHAT domain-containing protein [Candidatus Hydrogenedentota bacterium]
MARAAQELQRSGRLEMAEWRYRRAAELLGEGVDRKLEASILGYWANLEKELGNTAHALTLYQRALRLAEELGDVSGIVNRLNNIAALLGDNLANPTDAMPYLERALSLARKLGDKDRLVLILVHMAKRARELDRHDQAGHCLDEAQGLARTISHPARLADVLHERACLAAAQGRNEDAVSILHEALSLPGLDTASPVARHATQLLRVAVEAMRTGGKIHILQPGHEPPGKREMRGLPDLPEEIQNVLDPAMEHMESGRLAFAAKAFRDALNTGCVQRSPAACALAAMNLGDVLRELGETNEAIETCRGGLEWEKQVHLPVIRQGLLLNLGLALRTTGDWVESRAVYEQALDLADPQLDPDSRGRLSLALGDLLRDGNEFDRADRCYQQAAECAESAGDPQLQGAVLIGMGNLQFRNARRILQERETRDAQVLAMEFLEKAKRHYDDAVAFARQHRDPKLEALALRMLGNVYRRLQMPEQAVQALESALSLMSSDASAVTRAGRLNDLAVAEQQLGRFEDAREHYAQAVEYFRRHGVMSPDVAGCIENYGVLLVRLGRVDEGAHLMSEASSMDNRMVPQAFAIASESNRLGFLRSAESRLDDLISLVACGGPAISKAAIVEACADAVFARKGSTQEALMTQREFSASEGNAAVAATQLELAAVRTKLARLTFAGHGMRADGSYSAEASRLAEQRELLEQRMARHFPTAVLDRRLQHASCKSLMMHLDRMSVLIEYVRFRHFAFPAVDQEAMWGPERYAAFVLCDQPPVRIIDLGVAKVIDELIMQFRSAVTGHAEQETSRDIGFKSSTLNCVNDVRQAGEALRKAVFDPLLPAIGNRTRLLVAVDSELTRLPLEALPQKERDDLIDRYDISYLSTARDLLRPGRAGKGTTSEPVVVADPDFDLRGEDAAEVNEKPSSRRFRGLLPDDLHFERLPGSRVEGEAISRMLVAAMLTGDSALDGRVKQFRSPVVLHLATHAFFLESITKSLEERVVMTEDVESLYGGDGQSRDADDRTDPMLGSGICLAGVNTWLAGGALPEEAEDGVLTAVDVSGLDLQNTELVVLSACDTGLGRTYRGEGVFGLRRAFVTAGAKTLVMSLWKVADEQTSSLMQQFYEYLLEGKGRAEALRAAKLSIKRHYPSPFFWGAFICQGETGPLSWQQQSDDGKS